MFDLGRRHRFYPEWTAAAYLVEFAGELDRDGVNFLDAYDTGQAGFGFEGDDLTEFCRRAIHALLAEGGTPARLTGPKPPHFQPVADFGGEPAEIAEHVLSALRALGGRPDFGWLWFYRFEPPRPTA